jgi:septum formation protein
VATPLVLASGSPYRAQLLARLEIPFEVRVPDVDERVHDRRLATLGPAGLALAIARAKAASLGRHDAWVLAADQIAIVDGELLHKPGTPDAAVEQLMRLAGRTHALVTGVVLVHAATGAEHVGVDEHRLTMRAIEVEQARAYVRRHMPLDCVGSYRIEDPGIALFERIEGEDYTGIVGLPLLTVARLLRRAGLLV